MLCAVLTVRLLWLIVISVLLSLFVIIKCVLINVVWKHVVLTRCVARFITVLTSVPTGLARLVCVDEMLSVVTTRLLGLRTGVLR